MTRDVAMCDSIVRTVLPSPLCDLTSLFIFHSVCYLSAHFITSMHLWASKIFYTVFAE